LNFTKNSPFQFGAASQVKDVSPPEFKLPQADDVDSIRDSLDKFQLNSYQNEHALMQNYNEKLLAELEALKAEKKRSEPIGAAWEEYTKETAVDTVKILRADKKSLRSKMKSLESENKNFKVELTEMEKEIFELKRDVQFQKGENENLSTKFKNFDCLEQQLKGNDATIAELEKKNTILTQEFKNAQTPTQLVGDNQVLKITQFYLSTIIHEQHEIAFRCLCCHMISANTTLQFKCCSMLMCLPCFKKMPENNNCPGCRKSRLSHFGLTRLIRNNEVQKLKSILETLKESTVREICKAIDSKYTYERDEEADKRQARENDAVESEEEAHEDGVDKHLKGIFIKNLPTGSDRVSEQELQLLEPFVKASQITLPSTWTDGNPIRMSKRNFGFVQFRNREDCLESLALCRNYRINGSQIHAVQQKPKNDASRVEARRQQNNSSSSRSSGMSIGLMELLLQADFASRY